MARRAAYFQGSSAPQLFSVMTEVYCRPKRLYLPVASRMPNVAADRPASHVSELPEHVIDELGRFVIPKRARNQRTASAQWARHASHLPASWRRYHPNK